MAVRSNRSINGQHKATVSRRPLRKIINLRQFSSRRRLTSKFRPQLKATNPLYRQLRVISLPL
jgi:hypothetical protein